MVVVFVFAGLGLLFIGGEVLVRAAVAVAERLNISPVVIGLTIVAFGTSAPELTVALNAVLQNQADIAAGSVIGSNISNILLVLGVTALIQELRPERMLILRDGLFMLAVTCIFSVMAVLGEVTRFGGAVFVSVLVLYTFVSYWRERRESAVIGRRQAEVQEYESMPPRLLIALPLLFAGIASVVAGAEMLVEGAVSIATAWGISPAVIGLSVVAIGTSLPEMAISVMAALRGRAGVAVGNILGSNIANILGIIGFTGLVVPFEIARTLASYDIWIMVLSSVFLLSAMIADRGISRGKGLFFLLCYAAYITSLYFGVPETAAEFLGMPGFF